LSAIAGGVLALLLAGCNKDVPEGNADKSNGDNIRVGYVLHGLNEFTQIIKQGAEDAGQDEHIGVDVAGPGGFVATDAIAMFEGMTQKRVDGLVVIPMPSEVWVTPIRQATDAGIPVLTANVVSTGSTAKVWFGQDERASGVILAKALRKGLDAKGLTEGKIVVGICAPGVSVLEQRYEGFKEGMQGTKFQVTDHFDVTTENTANYSAWENLAGANLEVAAMVGLCSMDLPNLSKLKDRTKGKWLIGGYDLGRETLDGIRSGSIQVALGQHPYLQGYLPVAALARHVRDKQPLTTGWIDVGTEVITKENVDSVYARETDETAQKQWYADYVSKHFGDLSAIAKPLPKDAE
jgi:ABC-type sugar transport system substrate-binding protein